MSSPVKTNGEFLYQLDQSLPVWLYHDKGENHDDIPVILVLCEGNRWLDDAGPGDEKPLTLTVAEARYVIRRSIYSLASFHVETPAN